MSFYLNKNLLIALLPWVLLQDGRPDNKVQNKVEVVTDLEAELCHMSTWEGDLWCHPYPRGL